MKKKQNAFQIDALDNVATALEELEADAVCIVGEAPVKAVEAEAGIPKGHKISLRAIKAGEDVIKYGVCIGRASEDIEAGSWVHLHNIHSVYDERSSHLDAVTGAPKDIRYE